MKITENMNEVLLSDSWRIEALLNILASVLAAQNSTKYQVAKFHHRKYWSFAQATSSIYLQLIGNFNKVVKAPSSTSL